MKLKSLNKLVIAACLLIASCSYFPEDFDRSDIEELSETNKYIKLGNGGSKGLIFYPGGLVDPFAYVNFMSKVVTSDLNVFIAKVPYNLAILDIDHAEGIRKSFTEIENWSVMGHSLGGSVACFEVDNNLEAYDNLILLAAYPAANTDLTDYAGRVISIYGSEDEVLDQSLLQDSKDQFNDVSDIEDIDDFDIDAPGAYFYKVPGGNHANFGNYGAQNGDGIATISAEEQQLVVMKILREIL
jgi:hypothetical protein